MTDEGSLNERKNNKEKIAQLETRIDELERVSKALIGAIQQAEGELDEPLIKSGAYYGIEFSD